MPILCVIPARLGSTRLPSKPLRLIGGEPLIRLVARHVMEFDLATEIVVATDHPDVAHAVAPIGVPAVLTRGDHRSGTERVAEVAARAEFARYDIILNVQGDEPFLTASAASGAVERVRDGDPIGTAATPLDGDSASPSRVKVLVDARGRAVAFRRQRAAATACAHRYACFQHIGVYAYTRAALERWIGLPPVQDEIDERLEQLRPLAHGLDMGVAVVDGPALPGIDTEADLAWAQTHATILSEKGV